MGAGEGCLFWVGEEVMKRASHDLTLAVSEWGLRGGVEREE